MVENVQKKRKSHTKIYVSPLDCFYINILIEKCQTNMKIYYIFHKINIDVNFRIETNNRNVNLKRKGMQKGVSAGMNPHLPRFVRPSPLKRCGAFCALAAPVSGKGGMRNKKAKNDQRSFLISKISSAEQPIKLQSLERFASVGSVLPERY